MLLTVVFETLYRPANLRSASEKTIKLWKVALRHFSRHLGHSASLDDLHDDLLNSFVIFRLSRDLVQPPTVNRDLASLLALWRWCHRKNIVHRWPDVKLELEPRRIPICWTQAEFSRLLATAKKARGRIGEVPAAQWWTAILLLCFDSGERIGAVTTLEWNDLDLDSRWAVFRAETRKGRDADSLVRFAKDTATSLAELPRVSRRVFHWPYTPSYLWTRFGKLLDAAGLPNDRRRKFHCIRRTMASHAEAAGANATDLLRHASRRNTLAYLDPRILQPPQAIDVLWRP